MLKEQGDREVERDRRQGIAGWRRQSNALSGTKFGSFSHVQTYPGPRTTCRSILRYLNLLFVLTPLLLTRTNVRAGVPTPLLSANEPKFGS